MDHEITAHLTSGAVIVYAIEHLKNAGWATWINPDSKALNRIVSAIAAAAAVAGISMTFDASDGVMTITGLTAAGIGSAVWEWSKQYVTQQLVYDGFLAKTTTKPTAPPLPRSET